jgi:GGDEF domain-containing protein
VPPRISSGFALYPVQASTAESLLNLADQRMYAKKNEKRGNGSTEVWRAA